MVELVTHPAHRSDVAMYLFSYLKNQRFNKKFDIYAPRSLLSTSMSKTCLQISDPHVLKNGLNSFYYLKKIMYELDARAELFR